MTTTIVSHQACRWCGQEHVGEFCPLVKAVEIDPAGNITRVEFVTDADLVDKPEAEPQATYPKKGEYA